MPEPTKQDIINSLAKVHADNPIKDYMDDELKEGIDTIVSIAFEGLWPDGDERYTSERAAAGFVLGYAAGRDFEQGIAFNSRFGLES